MKTYNIAGYDTPQVMEYQTDLRLMINKDGSITLQKRVQGQARGEFTESYWIDVPIVNDTGDLIGYNLHLDQDWAILKASAS